MFIATAITNQSQLRQERNKAANTLRSYGATKHKQPRLYKHFIPTGLMGPRNLPGKQGIRSLLHRTLRFIHRGN